MMARVLYDQSGNSFIQKLNFFLHDIVTVYLYNVLDNLAVLPMFFS